ncbi:alkane hydroxylase MAH1-like [Citrus sinensis]|uniref:alkane hydroxylase MAH1-like n=1 Tax=Citrus sinensis TaxID=2711 RepID=UPI0022779A6B|nr:alkane hydroxylase MAH1-like [Citrus sinensis]
MAITFAYGEMIIAIFLISFLVIVLHWSWSDRNSPMRNWPVLGMLPGLLANTWYFHEFLAHDVLKKNRGTFEFTGPWFAQMDLIITSDPMNVHYISSKNFSNYPKGPDFRMIMEPLGDGVLNADGDLWKIQRKIIHSVMKHNKFESALEKVAHQKMETGLIPVLDHASELGTVVDLQDVLKRFAFDNICLLVLGIDPNYLSVEFPQTVYANAFNTMEQALLYRHIVPKICWKLQKWLQIGEEKKLSRAWKAFDRFLYQRISSRKANMEKKEEEFDLLTAYMAEEEEEEVKENEQISALRKTDKFLRDTAFNFLGAGNDTISSGLVWFFWLVATHPSVENKILKEIKATIVMHKKEEDGERRFFFNTKQTFSQAVITSRRIKWCGFLIMQWGGWKRYGAMIV